MALCRCPRHSPPDSDRYIAWVKPAGDGTALVCGRQSCPGDQPVIIWLDDKEVEAHRQGTRVFSLHTNTVRVRTAKVLHLRNTWKQIDSNASDPKETWLQQNTFYCAPLRAYISKAQCASNQKQDRWACRECKRNPKTDR